MFRSYRERNNLRLKSSELNPFANRQAGGGYIALSKRFLLLQSNRFSYL